MEALGLPTPANRSQVLRNRVATPEVLAQPWKAGNFPAGSQALRFNDFENAGQEKDFPEFSCRAFAVCFQGIGRNQGKRPFFVIAASSSAEVLLCPFAVTRWLNSIFANVYAVDARMP